MHRPTLATTAGALACCLALAAPARAEMTRTTSAGQWSAFSGTLADNQPVCAMSTTGAEGRRIAIQQNTGETGLHLLLDKASWAIPADTPIDIALQIDHNPTVALHGTGKGSEVDIELPFEQAVPVMRQLRRGAQIRVFFPGGNEAMWSGGLSGTSAVMNAFNDCRAGLMAAQAPATQPYASPPAAPTQPFTPDTSPTPGAPTAPTSPAAPAAPAPQK